MMFFLRGYKPRILLGLLLVLSLSVRTSTAGDKPLQPRSHHAEAARQFARMLPTAHLLQRPLDNTISARAWTNYLAALDYEHSYFLQSDIDEFLPWRDRIDDDLRSGELDFAFMVFERFKQRLAERCEHAFALLEKGFDFNRDEQYRWKRKDAPWPADREEQNELWRLRVKNEYLGYAVAREHGASNRLMRAGTSESSDSPGLGVSQGAVTNVATAPSSPEEFVRKRYEQFRIVIEDSDAEWVLQRFLSAVAAAYDPHTAYMAPSAMEDFNIEMNLSLGGIGAVLSPEDGAAKVREIIPGGPAARDTRDTRLREGDKIIGVGQNDGPIEDVLHLPLTQTVRKIRGKKGTRVVLQVVSASDPSGGSVRLVDLIRDDVKLEEQAATGHVARVSMTGTVARAFGVVRLPTFYGSMTQNPRDPNYRSCTRDVRRILAGMNDEIEGLVLDLRGNGGGSLREAVELAGSFIKLGPVVQVREIGRIHLLADRDPAIAFRKPMVVLVNRISASASEIVAAALQDYGRAVIVGDSRTHGKGSVQTIVPLGSDKRLGSLKVTCANYYRISGGSTQLRGVEPDIVIPSPLEHFEIGEDKLPNAMPWTQVPPAQFRPTYDLDPLIPILSSNILASLAIDERYRNHLRHVEHVREVSRRESLPLRKSARMAQFAAEDALRRANGLDDPTTEPLAPEGDENGDDSSDQDDLVLDAALRVLAHLADLQRGEAVHPSHEQSIEVQDWLRRIFVP